MMRLFATAAIMITILLGVYVLSKSNVECKEHSAIVNIEAVSYGRTTVWLSNNKTAVLHLDKVRVGDNVCSRWK